MVFKSKFSWSINISISSLFVLASMDIDFIFDQTVGDNIKDLGVIPGLTSAIFGTAEDAFRPNPREK